MIVFPMAGLSSRFTKAGYDRPKWMLPLAGRPLLDWSLLGFSEMFESETFLLIHLDRPGVAEFVRARAEAIGIRNLRMVALPEPTRGQAETVWLGLERLCVPDVEPVTIFNIDTIRPGVRKAAFDGYDGWLECFVGAGDHWSFALLTQILRFVGRWLKWQRKSAFRLYVVQDYIISAQQDFSGVLMYSRYLSFQSEKCMLHPSIAT